MVALAVSGTVAAVGVATADVMAAALLAVSGLPPPPPHPLRVRHAAAIREKVTLSGLRNTFECMGYQFYKCPARERGGGLRSALCQGKRAAGWQSALAGERIIVTGLSTPRSPN